MHNTRSNLYRDSRMEDRTSKKVLLTLLTLTAAACLVFSLALILGAGYLLMK